MKYLATFLKVLAKVMNGIQLAVPVAELMGKLLAPGQKTGIQKAEAVRQFVKAEIEGSELLVGKEILDQDLLDRGIQKITDGTVDILNAVRPKS